MNQCNCEHWQQCPVCAPHRFDAEGNRLPPEPTPLQSARAEFEALNQRLSKLQNAAQGALDALEGVLDRNPGEKILEMTITGGLYEVVQVMDAIKSLQCALSDPYSDIESDGGMDPRHKYEQAAKARDDIIRMARETGHHVPYAFTLEELERFAALVEAAEREACQRVHDLLEVHQAALEASEKPGPWPAKEVIDKAVAAEREACAKVAENQWETAGTQRRTAERCAAAIRARDE